MIRGKCALGACMLAFGAGLILAVLLQTGLCTVLLGFASLAIGAFLLCGNGA